jgi:steroid delta-isomerase-like uncharacterized protein
VAFGTMELARATIDCFNSGDFERLRGLLADESYEEELATQRRLEGADAQIDAVRGWKTAFPDGHGTIERAFESGNTVTLELTWEGTNSGPMTTPDGRELPPTGGHGSVKACQVMEIEDGQVVATRHYFDLMTLLQGIGAMESMAPAAGQPGS